MLKYIIILIFCLLAIFGLGKALRYIYKNRKKSQIFNKQQVIDKIFKTYDRLCETEISKARIQLLQNQLNETQSLVEKKDFTPPLLDQNKSSPTKSKIQVRKAELPDDTKFEHINVNENLSLKEKLKAKQSAIKNRMD
jgi:hypothetical protein